MASVTSTTSLASSLDLLVQQYQSSLLARSVAPVQTKQATLTSRLSALTTLKTKLSVLSESALAMSKTDSTSKFLSYTVANSNTAVLAASASSTATSGNHTLLVTQLAKADAIVTSRFNSATTTIVTNELTAAEKTAGSATRQIKVLVGGVEKGTVDVSLAWSPEADTNSEVLASIAAAINASADVNQSVSASVVAVTSSQSRLVITSKTTGSTAAVSLVDVGPGTLLDSIGLTDATITGRTAVSANTTADDPLAAPGGYLYPVNATLLDSKFVVDGLEIVRNSNTVSDVLTGVTFDLKSTQALTDTPVTLAVSLNKDQIRSNVQSFLTSYNAALSYVNAQTAVDATTGVRQVLASDVFVKSIRSGLRSIALDAVSGLASGANLLADIGITAGADGTLSISNASTFDTALASNPTKVSNLFNSTEGVAAKLRTYVEGLISTGGQMDGATDSISTQLTNLSTKVTKLNKTITRQVQKYRDDLALLQSIYDQANQQMQMIAAITSVTSYY